MANNWTAIKNNIVALVEGAATPSKTVANLPSAFVYETMLAPGDVTRGRQFYVVSPGGGTRSFDPAGARRTFKDLDIVIRYPTLNDRGLLEEIIGDDYETVRDALLDTTLWDGNLAQLGSGGEESLPYTVEDDENGTELRIQLSVEYVATPSPIRVACIGDSITETAAGHGVTKRWSDIMADRTGWTWDNYGNGGDRIADIAQQYTDNVDGEGYQYVICLAGVNDIVASGGGGDGKAFAASINAIGASRPASETMIRLQVLPFGEYSFNAADEPILYEVNSYIDDSWPSHAYFVDTSTPSGWGMPLAWSNDGLHPNQTGQVAMADFLTDQFQRRGLLPGRLR